MPRAPSCSPSMPWRLSSGRMSLACGWRSGRAGALVAAISICAVTKRYRDGTLAVRELDLEIGDGELMVLVGPSGCGKTTLLRMIAGLEEISGGEIRIGERIVNDLT